VEWEPAAPVTALGHLPFFVEFLKHVRQLGGGLSPALYQPECAEEARRAGNDGAVDPGRPLALRSHHGGARGWRQPGPAGDGASEDAVRRALKKMPERRSGCAAISTRRRCWGFRGFWTWMPRSNRCSATRKERAIIRTSRGGPLHTYWVAGLRLVLDVKAGNEHASAHSAPALGGCWTGWAAGRGCCAGMPILGRSGS
jgi:hypothetical protein